MRVVLGCNSISQTFESFYHQMKKLYKIFFLITNRVIYIYISVSNEDNKYTLLNFHDFQQEHIRAFNRSYFSLIALQRHLCEQKPFSRRPPEL